MSTDGRIELPLRTEINGDITIPPRTNENGAGYVCWRLDEITPLTWYWSPVSAEEVRLLAYGGHTTENIAIQKRWTVTQPLRLSKDEIDLAFMTHKLEER